MSFAWLRCACPIQLVVRGPAVVFPSTFAILSPGLAYSLQVGLSTQVPTGKVTLTTSRTICTDAAGNQYQRSNDSTKVVRFSRITPTLNLWTPIQNSQVQIGDQFRTVQATNASADIPIYLDFSEPIVGTSADLQGLLIASPGILFPRDRKSRGNRRFAFSVTIQMNSSLRTMFLGFSSVLNHVTSNASSVFHKPFLCLLLKIFVVRVAVVFERYASGCCKCVSASKHDI